MSINFLNGTYHIESKEFFEGDNEHTQNVGYNYPPDRSEEFERCFKEIIPDPVKRLEMRHDILNSFLPGKQILQKWKSNGTSGKSTLANILKSALGDYCRYVSVHQKYTSIELAAIEDYKIIIMEECDEPLPMNSCHALYSAILGDNYKGLFARKEYLYEDPGHKFKSAMSIISINNSNMNIYIEGKTKSYNFPIKFVENPQKEGEHLNDANMYYRAMEFGEGFMHYLLFGDMYAVKDYYYSITGGNTKTKLVELNIHL